MAQIKITQIKINKIELNFKEKFGHFLKTRQSSTNIILQIKTKDNIGYGESIPREYLTGETPDTVIKTLQEKIIPDFQNKIFKTKKNLLDTLWNYRKTLKTNQLSAFGAFEISLLHLAGKELNLKIEDIFKYFKLKPQNKNNIQYSAIIGESNLIKMIIKAYIIKKRNFNQVKIKTSQKTLYKLKYLTKILKNKQIRIDANAGLNPKQEIFQKTIKYLNKINIKIIEQPFKTNEIKANLEQNYQIAKQNNIKIILDESFCDLKDLKKLKKQGDIPNIRPTKIGGIMTSIYVLRYCEQNNLESIFACLVGETILTKINQIINQKVNTLAKEGNYDQFLFQNPIIKNKKFQKNGDYSEKINLNYKTKLNKNFKNTIKKELIINI